MVTGVGAVHRLDPDRHAGAGGARRPRRSGSACPDCPPELEAAILRMLAKDPAERFPSMAEAKAALGADPADGGRSAAGASSAALPQRDPGPSGDAGAGEPGARPGRFRRRAPLGRRGAGPEHRHPSAARPSSPPGTASRWSRWCGASAAFRCPAEPSSGAPTRPDVLHIDRIRNVATAVAPGSALLTASCDGVQTRVPVRVPPSRLERSTCGRRTRPPASRSPPPRSRCGPGTRSS